MAWEIQGHRRGRPPTSPLTKSSHPEKDISYSMTNEGWHTACGTADRVNRLRQRAATPAIPALQRSDPCNKFIFSKSLQEPDKKSSKCQAICREAPECSHYG